MADRDEQHLLGRFWLAGHPEQKLPGWLDVSGRNPKITLAGQLTAPVEWSPTEDGGMQGVPAPEFPVERFTVHGQLSVGNQQKVTLLQADTYPLNFQLFGDLDAESENGTQVFEGHWLIRGAHIEPADKILKAMVRFTYIDEWAARHGLTKYQPSFAAGKPVEVSYQEPESLEAPIPGGLGKLHLGHYRQPTSPTSVGLEIRHETWLRIDAEAASLDALHSEFVAPVLNLASVMLDRSCKITQLRVATENSELYDPVYHPTIRADRPVRPIEPGYSYLRLPDIDFATVANAVVAFRDIDPIPSILVSTFERDSGRFLETDLLELAACAEGLDLRLHKTGDKTYRQRLERLIAYTKDCVPEAAGVAVKWAGSLVNARNDYAHLLPGPRNTWKTNLVLWESLKWILGAAILLHAGVDAEVIKEGLKRHESYAFFVRKAKNYAPDIYSEPVSAQ
ncbi:HEPN domain-containing protein [Amycolatopsis sp. NPDC051102]|uniref:ApeA N-terminal domain 1-containing protein n=1 Tax=Amycolatopsis sp. NPDC051102 TaxID=3155163 RepID=UPI003449984C